MTHRGPRVVSNRASRCVPCYEGPALKKRAFFRFCASVAAVLLGLEGVARAQNADSFFYSNEAALTGGAVVAVPGDEGAAWYNPAGLGSVKRNRLNANGSVFGIRIRPVPNGLTSSVRGLESKVDLGGADFVATPTTASATFSLLPNLTLSGGAFHSQSDVRAASGTGVVADGTGRNLSQRLDSLAQQRKLHMGGAYGFDVGHGLRVGSAMFLVYSARNDSIDYLVGLDEGGQRVEAAAISVSAATRSWGLQSSYGVQWDVTSRLHVGAMFRFPELRIAASGEATRGSLSTTPETSAFDVGIDKATTGKIEWIAPARTFFGVAYDVSPIVRVAVDVDVSLGLRSDTWGRTHDATIRGRAGVLIKAHDAFHFGFGAFVDPASERVVPEDLASIRANYYGGTTGLIFRTKLGAKGGADAPTFNLSVAVRYAIGIGDARPTVTGTTATDLIPVVAHDIMPYFGSSVAF